MGYWRQSEERHSLCKENTGLIWGDEPADVMGEALDKIIAVFIRDRGRLPLEAEIKAGLLFGLPCALDAQA